MDEPTEGAEIAPEESSPPNIDVDVRDFTEQQEEAPKKPQTPDNEFDLEEPQDSRYEELAKKVETANNSAQEIKDRYEVDIFIANNPEMKTYRDSILKYAKHPAYKHVPIESIAHIVSAKDAQRLGALKERQAQEKVATTKTAGDQNRDGGSAPDWSNMPDDEFARMRATIFNRA